MSENDELSGNKCVPCEGGVEPLTGDEARSLLEEVPGWEIHREGETPKLRRGMEFKDFREALSFVNRVGEIAETEGHHPDIHLTGYNNVRLEVYTHAIGGLHRNDFILAAKVNRLRGE